MDIYAIVAGGLVLISVSFSLYAIVGHLRNFTKPYLQRYIIRILFMVPIYSMNAWIAMVVPGAGLYLDSLREVYESFVIYSFMKYLLNFLHYDTNLQQFIDHKPGVKHIVPFCCFPTCIGGRLFMVRCKHGILQYVVIRPLTTLIAFTSQIFNFYGEGNFNPLSGYTYPVLLIINNLSQLIAMYSLVLFYTGYRQELDPMQPIAKFLSIKLVVFFSFFQSVIIAGLLEWEVIEETVRMMFPDLMDKISLGRKLQEILICVDMFIAAIGHFYAFPHRPFTDYDLESSPLDGTNNSRSRRRRTIESLEGSQTCCQALCSILDFSDEKSDFSEHFSTIFRRVKRFFTRGQPLPSIITSSECLNDNWMSPEDSIGETSASVRATRVENYKTIE